MIKGDTIHAIKEFAITSEIFLCVRIDKSGEITSSNSGLGPIPSFFDQKEKPIYFSDCFLSSDWTKFESQRTKAWKNSHQSFVVELQKINHPDLDTVSTRWEFFFVSEDFGTCFGIGHKLSSPKPYHMGIGDFFDQNSGNKELLDILLEDRLMGFWEFDLNTKTDSMSQSLGQILGYSKEELEKGGKILWEKHIHAEDLEELDKDLNHYFKTSGNVPFRKEFRIFSKNNQLIWALGFGKTITWTKEGLPIKVLGCLVDISEKKRQESWMIEHRHFLKKLAYDQCHSLRARVANILGALELLDAEPKNDDAMNLITLIKAEANLLDLALKKSISESVQKNQALESKDHEIPVNL